MERSRRRALMLTVSDITTPLGPAVSTLSVAEAMGAAGYDVTLLAPRQGAREPVVAVPGLRLVWTPAGRTWRLPITFDLFLQLRTLVRELRGERPDLLYIRHSTFAAIAALLGRLWRVPLIVAEHNSWQADERRHGARYRWLAPVEGTLQSWLGRLAHRNRVVIADNADALVRAGVLRERIYLRPNGTNVRHVVPVERSTGLRRFGLAESDVHLGFVGSFAWWQGLPDLIPALRTILERCPRARLLLAGDGPAREAIQQRADELGIADRVNLLGVVAYAELPLLLATFDLALLPTALGLFVGAGRSPMKLGDYAAAGRAILATRIAGFEALEAEGALALYEPGREGALAEAALALIENPTRRAEMGKVARRLAVERLSWDVCIAPLIAP
jgi:glycosyltransferase involved in cell wall biosynthesis